MPVTGNEFGSAMRVLNIARSSRVAIALSGGIDSMALVYLAKQYLDTGPATITVDHGMRPESSTEALMV